MGPPVLTNVYRLPRCRPDRTGQPALNRRSSLGCPSIEALCGAPIKNDLSHDFRERSAARVRVAGLGEVGTARVWIADVPAELAVAGSLLDARHGGTSFSLSTDVRDDVGRSILAPCTESKFYQGSDVLPRPDESRRGSIEQTGDASDRPLQWATDVSRKATRGVALTIVSPAGSPPEAPSGTQQRQSWKCEGLCRLPPAQSPHRPATRTGATSTNQIGRSARGDASGLLGKRKYCVRFWQLDHHRWSVQEGEFASEMIFRVDTDHLRWYPAAGVRPDRSARSSAIASARPT